METKYKITIPTPCHEDWNQMTPNETGRFCNSCVKSVVDFTGMKTFEIQEYFIKNQGQKVCGRFNNQQLDSIIIQIPRDILFSQVQFHKIFMLALLVSMGTTLFSCQNANGDKQNIDKVEVVDSINGNRTMGEPMPEKDTINKDTVTETIVSSKKGPIGITGEIVLSGLVSTEPLKPTAAVVDKDFIYPASTVEIQPTYPGGIAKFFEYLKSNFKVSQEYKDISGKIILSFVVDRDGSLTDIKVVRGINTAVDNELLMFIKASPKWIPGEQHGEKVKVSYALPIKITAKE